MKLISKLIFLFSIAATWNHVTASEIQKETKVVLITGASRGIGLATAEHLAKNGYCVYAGVRNSESLDLPSHQNIHFEKLDVTNLSTIQNTVSKIIKKEGHLDILINNAGYAVAGPVESLEIKEVQEQMDVNFFGMIRVCQEVLPHMRKQQKGHIINISSEQGTYGLPYGSSYTASKAALESLSEALSIEVSPWNIAVTIVEPGHVATNFSVIMGSRKMDHNPYQTICDGITKSLQEKKVPSETCQSPQEIAQFLKKVIEDPEPKLRYQTSKAAEETVSMSLRDTSGSEYTKRMKALFGGWLANP